MISMGEVDNSEELTCDIGCKVGKRPTSYLGASPRGPRTSLWPSFEVVWQFSNEKEPSWKNIIKGKFEEEERGYRLGWDMFNSKASFAVGSRSRVKFWKDRWYNEEPLCETFPSLFALSDSKEAWVAYLWEQRGERR
ncbi:hypothetical protein CK203_021359 [Vitis vinifera]|uniref:Reverse transcriptase zinc-binding domain-containing protein n=1 Tax=Vitis vinifera TaxID=29760 RepID=A0A438IS94_VITVI|nr:hypothetical protein CK203_021359 [Vitis vinifera]